MGKKKKVTIGSLASRSDGESSVIIKSEAVSPVVSSITTQGKQILKTPDSNWKKLIKDGKIQVGVKRAREEEKVEPDVVMINDPPRRKKRKLQKLPSLPETDEYKKTANTKYIALDCEMVGVGPAGVQSVLARVSIVNKFGYPLYDTFVKASEEVTDYRTKFSGVREEDLRNAKPFKVVQEEVARIIKDKIIVGHHLENDFKALLLSHPFRMTRDTAKYRPLQKGRGRPMSLRELSARLLKFKIQTGEHDPTEDARAALLLYKKYKEEWEKKFEKINLKIKRKKKKIEKRKAKSKQKKVIERPSESSLPN